MNAQSSVVYRLLLGAELFAFFVLVPFTIWQGWLSVPFIVLPLYGLCLYALIWLLVSRRLQPRQLWFGEAASLEKAALITIAKRFVLVVALVWWVVVEFFPDNLLVFPAEHFFIWLLFVALYPLFSVIPQELLFRAFFFRRYADIIPDKGFMITLSTLLFAFMHIVFANGIVILCTLIGGYFFADTYARTGSLRVVCLEHALYGGVIFTFGLGEFFVFESAKTLLQ